MAGIREAIERYQQDDDDETTDLLVVRKGARNAERVILMAQRVHQLLGPGLERDFYCRALAVELTDSGLDYERDVLLPIVFRGQSLGKRRIDFLIEDLGVRVLTGQIGLVEISSLRTTLQAAEVGAALLLSFGPKLELRRLQVRPGER